ncbi:MAG: hypothetical protein OEV61_04835, partial [Chloroflexota bacterium]|nr:hypothetical protein [Chloroflexota bacterium]
TPKQLASATLTPVSGTVVVTSRWEGPLDPSSLHREGVSRFTRFVSPAGTVGLDDVVVVEYQVGFLARDLTGACWRITDFAPSGLAPIIDLPRWWVEDDEDLDPAGSVSPWSVSGQRVDFCLSRDSDKRSLRYMARVVTPGTYRWEPAIIQSPVVQEWGMVVPATTMKVAAE